MWLVADLKGATKVRLATSKISAFTHENETKKQLLSVSVFNISGAKTDINN